MSRLSSALLLLTLLTLGPACHVPGPEDSANARADRTTPAQGESTRTIAAAPALDWCAGHGVPESQCTICNPQLAAQYRASGDWCREHSLPESVCPLCGHGVAPPPGLAGSPQAVDWCVGHGVPESQCTLCNPELAAGYRASGDWCLEHSLPESVCPLCGHGVAPPPGLSERDWCAAHFVPESKCTTCNPELIPEFQARGDWCAEHAVPESACRLCGNGFERPSVAGLVIRFKDAEREQAAGLQTRSAASCGLVHVIEAPARIDHDRNRLSQVTAPLGGVVRRVEIDLGDTVSAGVELFVMESLELAGIRRTVGPARSRVSLAREQVKRERLLDERGIGSLAAVQRAQIRLAEMRSELGRLEARLELAGPAVDGDGTYAVRAPSSGTVVERSAVRGTPAGPDTVLALLSDVQSAWAWADVQPEVAAQLEEGLAAEVLVPGADPIVGEVTWISPQVDRRTRTVAVRIQLEDPDDQLRLNQYGEARLSIEEPDSRPIVPSEALQQVEDELVVFVKSAPLTYETRVVTTGYRRDGGVEVDGAIGPGDPIVTVGAYLLKTELLRDSIGAGCCEVDSIEGE
jgi:cobalt-zinc-cadmium efflux system membrane fusion protein